MNENRKDFETQAESANRSQWSAPVLRKVNAQDAEADVNANTDGAAFS
jgi:hypothetical protein